jgi:predicted Zn-dependent protease
MRELTPPDNHHLNAATGWLELGNHAEAKAELIKISSASRENPEVLELEWRICAAEKSWPDALEAARRLVQTDPDNVSGWIHQSYSLHELKRTKEAFDLLLPMVEKFPDISTIPYNLACYACQLANLDEARQWLATAIKIRSKEEIRKIALIDPDLQPLWEEIKQL